MIGNKQEVIRYISESSFNTFEVKEYHEKRSLTANGYYQTLLTQLSLHLGIPRQELHFRFIKECSPALLVPIPKGTSPKNYFRYYEYYKNSTINGKEACYYKVYKGTSEMDRKEFTLVLNDLIQECNAIGIPTLSDEEVEKLKWNM